MLRIFRNLGWLLGSRAANAGFSLAYLGLATRSLGLADFGRFSLIVVLAQTVCGIASFQTWQAVVRWGAIPGEKSATAGFALALDLASIAAGLMFAGLACWSLDWWLPDLATLQTVAFAQCAAALLAIRSTPTGLLRLDDRYDLAALAEASLPATRAVGAGVASLSGSGIAGFCAAWAVADLVCAASHWALARGRTAIALPDMSLRALPARHPGIWRFVWATNLSRTLAVTAKQAMLLLVGALAGPAVAGGYRVAMQLGQAMVQLGEALSRAAYPEFVRQHADARALALRMTWLAAGAGTIAVLIAWFCARPAIVLLAGESFAFVAEALLLLAVAGAFELLSAGCEALLVSRKRAVVAFAVRAAPLLVAFAALPIAASRGVESIAAVVAAASAITACGFGYLALARPDIPPSGASLIR